MVRILGLVFSLLFSFSVLSSDKSSGCGAGWYIFKKSSLLSSTLRATTNGIFLNGTFGMTFGTSNCAKHSIVKNDFKTLHFTEATLAQLKLEVAQGEGVYLSALADLVGCAQNSSHFGKVMKKNYQGLFPNGKAEPKVLLNGIDQMIKSHSTLSKNCGII